MTRSLARNAITDPEHAAVIRARISGRELPAVKRKSKHCEVKNLCSQFKKYDPPRNRFIVQLARHIKQPRRFVRPKGMSYEQAERISQADGRKYVELRDGTSETFELYFPKGLPALSVVEFVRFSRYAGTPQQMDGDNLEPAFKAIRDGLSRYARHGLQWREHKAVLGHADGYLQQQGVKWIYRQMQCQTNALLNGIQIILHCAPPTTE